VVSNCRRASATCVSAPAPEIGLMIAMTFTISLL
jgi:hypothetical protein